MEMISAKLLEQQDIARDDGSAVMPALAVVAHMRARTRGVDAQTAQARTKDFFRSSANNWTRVLS